jgi:hypothetical protein
VGWPLYVDGILNSSRKSSAQASTFEGGAENHIFCIIFEFLNIIQDNIFLRAPEEGNNLWLKRGKKFEFSRPFCIAFKVSKMIFGLHQDDQF